MVPSQFTDNFSGTSLDMGWYQLRTPYTRNFELARTHSSTPHRQSGVYLRPNVFGLDDRDTPAALLRKQKSLNMTFSAEMMPIKGPLTLRQTVGISAYLSEFQHQDVGVTGCANSTGTCIYTTLKMNDTTIVRLQSSSLTDENNLGTR